MTYRIFETDGFKDDLTQDFGGRREKILRKLRNYSPETWRYRIGEYRFFYQIDEQKKIIFMIAADHRKQAYRK